MNSYEIWADLAPGANDLEFVAAVRAYLDWFVADGRAERYRIRRRKFGFGPSELGEFCITIDFKDLAQMDMAFGEAAKRSGDLERMHGEVYSRVVRFRSALYRDFPDPVREAR
ncbi:MAG: hypothetical protein MH204_11200 [Fimbriimonadaceae bacterium]|nr:hypothetical protein [Fimbriimonadaceae bacterium]